MGLTNASSGLYNISLSSSNGSSIIDNLQLSSFSSFLSFTTLFYAYGLNDSMTHTLTITNAEDKTLAVDGLNITVVNGGKRYVRIQINSLPFHTFFPPKLRLRIDCQPIWLANCTYSQRMLVISLLHHRGMIGDKRHFSMQKHGP